MMATSGLYMYVHKDARSLIHTCENTYTHKLHSTQIKAGFEPTMISKKKKVRLLKFYKFQRDFVFTFLKFAAYFFVS